MLKAVLFDLDGTLADTAPDLGGALNALLVELGHQPLPLESVRPYVSQGARGMIGAALGITPEHTGYAALQTRFLDFYEGALCVETRLFDGIAEHLDALDANGLPWGIVTNKSQRFALPLVEALGLRHRSACVIGGDTARHPKPYAHPMTLASEILGIASGQCLYVGDDERDIIAGRSAGMKTVAAAWGYLGDGKPPHEWGADWIAHQPGNILPGN